MPGEMAQDEVISDALAAYKINVHNIIFDTVTQSMDRRFLANGQLYADFSCLDPKRCHGSNWPEGTILGLARSQGATCGEVEGSFGSRPRK
jgi:hypothetical protein